MTISRMSLAASRFKIISANRDGSNLNRAASLMNFLGAFTFKTFVLFFFMCSIEHLSRKPGDMITR